MELQDDKSRGQWMTKLLISRLYPYDLIDDLKTEPLSIYKVLIGW